MAEKWTPLALNSGIYANSDEDAVQGAMTAIENGFVNEKGVHTRFPGLIERASLDDSGRVYLHELDGDMVAATSKGQVYRIDRRFTVNNVTGLAVSGGRRVIFAPTDRELLMAAGGPIIRLREARTELLSENAPLSTHVGWIDDYTIATEINSGRFYHSPAGQPEVWDPLDTFAADGNPDNINSLIVTPFRELMLGGPNSMEQFERLPTGSVPFFRRYSVGDGVKLPYVVLFADNAVWTLNNLTEFVRFSGQQSQAASAEIGAMLEKVDDWTDAWLGGFPDSPMHTLGQKFMVLQAPKATNAYGTKGVTLLFDYKNKRFTTLFGWDLRNGVPVRWPGWSHWTIWEKTFVGGEGKIYEVSDASHRNGSDIQRWLIRTSHISETSELQIRNFRLRITRGKGMQNAPAPTIQVRCSRNRKPFGPWIRRSLGKPGDTYPVLMFGSFGNGHQFQWEISTTDDCPVDLVGADVLVTPIGH